MSWNGPVAGAAPYQQPPHTNSVNGLPNLGYAPAHQYPQQPGSAYSQHGVPSESRPPKKKGNPIITRYPPPPGYRGPAQPPGPFGASQYSSQYQPPPQNYSQGPHVPSTYPVQAFQGHHAGQGYHSHGYVQQQAYVPGGYQWPQQPNQHYPSYPSASHPQVYPAPQGYPQYPSHPPMINTNTQAWPSGQGWQQPPYSASENGLPVPDPSATLTPSSAHPISSQVTPTVGQPQSAATEASSGEKTQLFLAWDDWDYDFDGAIWPKANEPVDPNLSLGVITWRPAKQVTRALPSTFDEAEEQSLKPPAEKLGNGESVSLYFTAENSHEAFLNVRQTDGWYKIRKDPVFVVFSDEEMQQNLLSLKECAALCDRPDEPLEDSAQEDEEMHDPTWNVMDNLEQALSGDMEGSEADMNPASQQTQDAPPPKDQAQEDVLARLGVTGSPKPPSNEPILIPFSLETKPPSLPEKPPVPPPNSNPSRYEQSQPRSHSYGGHHNFPETQIVQRGYGSLPSVSIKSLPLPPPPLRPSFQPCGLPRVQNEKTTPKGPSTDYGVEYSNNEDSKDILATQLKRGNSSFARKRSYEDSDNEDGKQRQHDDHTKRKRRSQVDSAYSRR